MLRHLTLAWLLLLSGQAFGEWLQHQWQVMGTQATLEFWQDATSLPAASHPLTKAIEDEFARLNAALSPWVESSELFRVNARAAETAQPISDELLYLLEKSRYYYELTHGAFDITFASVGHLYDYRSGVAPDDTQLQKNLALVGFNRIIFDGAKVKFASVGTRIDLGGIAKGYAIDRAIEILRNAGISHAYVSLGGDGYVLGDRMGRDWQVGIRHPRDPNAVAMKLPVSNIAISTSGDYERFFMRDGERIHHIIDPGNGRSSQGLVSVTILAEQSVDADALSTSVFVLGAQKGLEMINNLEGVSAVLITAQGSVIYSDDLMPPALP